MIAERAFDDLRQAGAALADRALGAIGEAVSGRGRARAVLTGGSSVRSVLPVLAGGEVDWSQVLLTLSDERWVPATHRLSNEGLVRRALGKRALDSATLVGLRGRGRTPAAAAAVAEARLRQMDGPFDVVVLAMGADGHVASWFPGCAAAWQRARVCVAVSEPSSGTPRLTLTPRRLLDSRLILLLVGAPERFGLYRAACGGAGHNAIPAAVLLAQGRVPVEAYLVYRADARGAHGGEPERRGSRCMTHDPEGSR